MCFPKPSTKAADEANRIEQERQAKISATQATVNSVFDDPRRAAEIEGVVSAVRQQQLDQLNEQNTDVTRDLKFNLARGGQIGGSLQADMNARQSKAYQRALLKAEQGAQGIGSKIRMGDDDARARLITLATSGLDATTGAAQSASAMRQGIDSARSDALAQGAADAFSGFKTTYAKMREDYDRRRGINDSVGMYGRLSG